MIPHKIIYALKYSSAVLISQSRLATLKKNALTASIILFTSMSPHADTSNTAVNIPTKKSASRPNIIWLISEDNSKHYLRLYAPQGAKMPSVDFLAEQGIIFENAFSNSPVCSTARTTLATGAYGPRIGTAQHRAYSLATLPSDLEPLSLTLKNAGYYTTNNAKEDYNFVQTTPLWHESSSKADWRNRSPGQAFFHAHAFPITHEYNLHFPAEDVKTAPTQHEPNDIHLPPIYPNTELFRYTYARTLDNHLKLDAQLAEVIEQLKITGVLEDTFIFFFGDHGGVLPGSKGYLKETGLSVPFVLRVPKNFKHLMGDGLQSPKNTRVQGFVNFVDFAPSLLNMLDITPSSQHDGSPFLGPNISKKTLNKRNTSFAYADRFDEKYDLVRSLRKGKYKYVRNYQPFNPDALYNSYRYKQAAYKEWKALFQLKKLNAIQAAFFKPKDAEALYDIEADPFETVNLLNDTLPNNTHRTIGAKLRQELQKHLKKLPDLNFYPESYINTHALNNTATFAQTHKQEIEQLIRIADLQLEDFSEAKKELVTLLASENIWQRYWTLISLSAFSIKENSSTKNALKHFHPLVKNLLKSEPHPSVKIRAIEFLALNDQIDAKIEIEKLIEMTDNTILTLEIFNTATLLHDIKDYRFNIPFKPAWAAPEKPDQNNTAQTKANYYFNNRVNYLMN